jgi:4-amino-4-deoxy-L-arabinose transferase-like glycosyltransferase
MSSRASGPFGRRLLAVTGIAIAARVAYALVVAPHDNPSAEGADVYFFTTVARLIADGTGYVHPFVWDRTGVAVPTAGHPPLWPALLAGPAALGLDGTSAARVLGAVVGGLTCVPAGLLARRLGGARAGLLAAALVAGYPAFVSADTSGMSEPLYVLLVAVALMLAVRVAQEGPGRRLGRAAALGGCLGVAALTRTEGLLLVVLLAWPAILLARRRRPAALAVATLTALVVIAPWTVRNAMRLDAFVPVSTNDSAVYAGANCPETYGGRDLGLWSAGCVFRASAPAPGGSALYDEGVLQRRWRHAGLTYARAHAGRLAAVVPVRVLRTWSLWQPVRQARLEEGQNRAVAVGALGCFYLLLAAAAAALALRRRLGPPPRGWALLAAPAASVTLVSAIGWGFPRFRHPVELALLVLVAVGFGATRPGRGRAR